MITWTELFAFCMFVVALIALVKQIDKNKEVTAKSAQITVTSL